MKPTTIIRVPVSETIDPRSIKRKVTHRNYVEVPIDYDDMKQKESVAKQRKTLKHRQHQLKVTKDPRIQRTFQDAIDKFILVR